MSVSLSTHREDFFNPIDQIEDIFASNNWYLDRRSDKEMAIEVPGSWCDLGLFFSWSENLNALHFSCALDIRIESEIISKVYELVAKLNERLWIGHFAVWIDEGIPMFRHTINCNRSEIDPVYINNLVNIAIRECDQYYPVFQFVIWGGKTVDTALSHSLVDTVGQA